MSNKPNDGGPAFPFDWKDFQPHTGEQVVREQFQGMTLRDYFAAKALPSVMAPDSGLTADPVASALITTWEDMAKGAYMMADAMLKERDKCPAKPAA